MRIGEILAELLEEGIRLRLEGDRLVSDAPRGALTEARLAQIRGRKDEIIAFLKRTASTAKSPLPPIEVIPRTGELPLSYAQRRAWFLEQIQPGCPIHNIPGGWKLIGSLDVAALRQAFAELVRRHEVLRQRFSVRDGKPEMTIDSSSALEIPLVDLRNVPEEEREGALMAQIADEVRRPLDLARPPLVRAVLYRVANDVHALFFMPHHIVWDAWSFDLMLNEVSVLYEAFAAGRPSPLPDLPIQYVDYAAWENALLEGDALDGELAYWKAQLGGSLPVLDIATDFVRPDAITYSGTSEVVGLSPDLVERIRVLASNRGATPYMVALTAVGLLLSRYSGQHEVIVGCPIENTMRPEVEPLIGYFVNMLPMRVRIDETVTFNELLDATRETCLDAFEHQHLPFERLVEALKVPRDTSRTPVFQAILLYQDAMNRPEYVGDLRLEQFNVPMGSSQADVHFWLKSARDGWLLGMDYSTDLFRPATAQRMLQHLRRLIDMATSTPGSRVEELDVLLPEERRELLEARNATEQEIPPNLLVHALFEAQADRTPDRVAVVCGDQSVSYAELEARANRLAHELRELGVGRGSLVGVALERSVRLPEALLGVLKAGGAYLPLDPEFPTDRLAYMLSDSEVRVVVTERALLDDLPDTGAQCLCIDRDAGDIERQTAERRLSDSLPMDLAYTIYTSGSTGRPKGVELMHENAVNFLRAMVGRPGIASGDVLLAVTTLSFDISVLELFLPLTVGARVVVATRDEAADGELLASRMEACGATMLQATPATWRMLLDAGWQGSKHLRALCGGEALPLDLARTLAASCQELWNMYGPTETTVWSTCARIPPDVDAVRIGSPIANTQVYVLDERKRPTPPGVPGELYIGGFGVARGYRRQPELSAERFVRNPFVSRNDARMYRTGDRARWHADGTLECLGRLDNQVKVRGFRIELGEVEASLVEHPHVEQAVVAVSRAGSDYARLVGYVVFEKSKDATASEIRRFLRERLPDYMVPGIIVTMDRLPLTPNGKVDRKALPDPLEGSAYKPKQYTPPATPEEALISEVWRDLLGVERVSNNDNFYEIGGHSLLSLRAVVEIEKRSGRRIDPRAMFFQTVEQLAQGLQVHEARVS